MPDFTVALTPTGPPWPIVLPWIDTATPSRQNAHAGIPHRYWSVPFGKSTVKFSCTVGGVFEPMDAALGGRLFLWSWVECPMPLPVLTMPAGQSSVVAAGDPAGTAMPLGAYLLMAWRPSGGSVAIPFVVE